MNIIGPRLLLGPTGPTTKNQLNHVRMGLNGLPNTIKRGERSEKEVITVSLFLFFFFFPPSGLLFHHAMATKSTRLLETASYKGKRKTQGSREDHISSKVGFFKFCYLLFLTNNYKTVILKHRHHFL